MPTLHSLQIGQPQHLGDDDAKDPMDRAWVTAFFKQPVAGPVAVTTLGLAGDGVADRYNHGGLDKAICAYSLDHYDHWRATLGLDEMPTGAFGENFTLTDMNETGVCIGDVWGVGEISEWDTTVGGALADDAQSLAPRVKLQVSQPRQPCWKLARRWRIKTLTAQVANSGLTGWYFRVLVEGTVASGMPLTLLERPCPDWTIARCNELMYHDKHNKAAAKELAYLPQLSASWREHFMQLAGELG
jgi:MOSC domain-containing protein YiiM